MDGSLKRKVVAGAAAALAVGGTGAGVAATKLSHSPREESQAVVNDAAKQLGVEPSKLSAALKKAYEDRVDAAVADGSITKAEGDALKQRLESDGLPLVAPPLGFRHFGFHDHGQPGLPAAAKYLGLSETQLESKLESGKTLAQVAKDRGKSVDGLIQALADSATKRLDADVAAGRLTKAQEQQILSGLKQRITDFVNGLRDHDFRFDRGFAGPPPGGPPPGYRAA